MCLKRPLLISVLLLLSGCANLTVSKVTDTTSPNGIRYSLPQPTLQVVPQADGSIIVDVVYLPDSSHTYAIETDSEGSTYSYQVSISQSGLLNAIEFKEDTSAVGQQLAATAGAATAQTLNIQNAQLVAAQSAVNTAQASADAAKALVDAAAAQLQADTASGVPAATINTDKAALAVAQAKLQDALAVLDRAKNTAVAVTISASAGTPITTSGSTPGTTGFGAQTWQAGTQYDLPSSRGVVMYVIDDQIDSSTKLETVSLKAQLFPGYPSTVGGLAILPSKQQSYPVSGVALVTNLAPQGLTYQLAAGSVNFAFDRPILNVQGSRVEGSDGKDTGSPVVKLDPDMQTIFLDTSKLKAGTYQLTIRFVDGGGQQRNAVAKFSLQ